MVEKFSSDEVLALGAADDRFPPTCLLFLS